MRAWSTEQPFGLYSFPEQVMHASHPASLSTVHALRSTGLPPVQTVQALHEMAFTVSENVWPG